MKEIGILIYPDAQQAEIYGLSDLFRVANQFAVERKGEEAAVLRISHWQIDTLDSTPRRINDSDDDVPSPPLSALILPPTLETPPLVSGTSGIAQWLRAQHQQGTILGSVCAGAFMLASTDLMAGRSMTTHWIYGDRLRQHFPAVQVDTNQLIIDDGDIISAGSVMSWSELGL